ALKRPATYRTRLKIAIARAVLSIRPFVLRFYGFSRFLATEVISVQEFVRYFLAMLEPLGAGQNDRSKDGANHRRVGMFTPDRVGKQFHHILPQGVVASTSDLIQQTSYT